MRQDLVSAVLTPPDLRRFREITGVDDAELAVRFDGWSKLALLSKDRVFLFPRWDRDKSLLHGAAVSEVLTALGVACVPRVLGRWPAGVLSAAGPFVAYERRPGVNWQDVEADASLSDTEQVLRSLGRLIATWHRIDLSALTPNVVRPLANGQTSWLGGLLDPNYAERKVEDAVRLLDAPAAWASTWRTTIRAVSVMPSVLIHGDVCENQLLINENGQVETVLDWDTAAVGHPLYDFNFGEWGFGIFRWEAEFRRLRGALWEAYASERGKEPGGDELPGFDQIHLVFTLAELASLEERDRRGTLDEWGSGRLALYRQEIGPATLAVGA